MQNLPSLIDYLEKNKNKKNLKYENFDINAKNRDNENALMYVMSYNKMNNLNVTVEQFDYLLKHSDLGSINIQDMTALMIAFMYNSEEGLNLNSQQWSFLLEHTNLAQQDESRWNAMMYLIRFYKDSGIGECFNNEHMNYIIENIDLLHKNDESNDVLRFLIMHGPEQEIKLNAHQWSLIIEKQKFSEDNKKLLGVINFFMKGKNWRAFDDFWRNFEDKKVLLNLINKNNKNNKFNKLLKIQSVAHFIQREQLDKMIDKAIDKSELKVNKL